MNHIAMMKMKNLMENFKNNHPKVPMFLAAASDYIQVGSVIEVNIQDPQGRPICTNIRVTEDDIELIKILKEMTSQR